jgi:hypothetical protein
VRRRCGPCEVGIDRRGGSGCRGSDRSSCSWALVVSTVLAATARAQDDISISIEKHARLTVDGGVVARVHVACGPLPGTEDFREGSPARARARRGPRGKVGSAPNIVCDGVERVYTAALSSFTDEAFRRGPATASVAGIACNTVGSIRSVSRPALGEGSWFLVRRSAEDRRNSYNAAIVSASGCGSTRHRSTAPGVSLR